MTVDHATGSCAVRVYTPETDADGRPLFVWCHGGAWAAGDLEGPEADATAREVCVRADAVVVSVDYRLAKDGVHYPVPLDDVVAAYLWAVDKAKDLGADPARVTLGGASAGGNLAAGAALRVRDEGAPMPAALLLAYPCLHPELPPASPELQEKLDRLSPAAAFAPHLLTPIVENYLGAPISEATPYAMPGLADDLTGLPPTMIINDEYDGLRASGEHFARQLREAGVEVVLDTVPDVDHGHLARPALPQLEQTYADMARWVKG
ncbi:acetyl esterase/lipase [Thermocatellispora tengchongensis]|uniref:Acetyl esterase/lipase n=1 Tax=Thermocatellispora tengchongensis TaxID=1073253 RepID=A0A840PHD4_9ACTN|nr:alpha/beta hydrolase fold domain-containing protein [Thermocatellispora tengchongensis]MBB5136940.1 acetyl esterase/lipase [Thermocatellispora tengchongensis]